LTIFDAETTVKERFDTIRRVPFFGQLSSGELPNFQWPKKKDLISMPKDKPI
jgi:hypothetical protein